MRKRIVLKPFFVMVNILKIFLCLSFLIIVSCSKEPVFIPEIIMKDTVNSRSSSVVEMEIIEVTYNSLAEELVVYLEANSDLSETSAATTQTLVLVDNTSISLQVASSESNGNSLQIVFSTAQAPSCELVEVQEIIIEDTMIN